MQDLLWIQPDFILRLAASTVCGILIGYERESSLKLAGIRTHSIVALTAALMMIISKYGFYDVISANVTLDPSRIAAGIVTAIGFLGAGVIFTRKMSVSGLTTAAGLWATVGIGMAIGSGLYLLGVIATILILLLQFLFHLNIKLMKSPSVEKLVLHVSDLTTIDSIIARAFTMRKIKIITTNVTRLRDDLFEIKLYVTFPEQYSLEQILTLMQEVPEVVGIDVTTD